MNLAPIFSNPTAQQDQPQCQRVLMATVTISQHWPDNGGCTSICVDFEDSYPDAMTRACDEAVRTWMVATGADAEDDD